jgi:hypothetical protein
MNPFPSVDPIPLPAPVWLFKVLHNLTFALHLASVELLLGGLMLGIMLAALGRMQNPRNMVTSFPPMIRRMPG